MDTLICSKYLYVRESEDSFLITHLLNGITIRVKQDLIDLMDRFIKPALPSSFETEYADSNYADTILKLQDIHFLNKEEDEEEYEVLNKWRGMFKKKAHIYPYQDGTFDLTYYSREEEPIHLLPEAIANICSEISSELFPFQKGIQVYFLSHKEYDEVVKLYNIPQNVKAFVEAKVILILNYEMFFNDNNSDLFYPVIRHEAVHLLLGQYKYHMPFWVEEGICELYSGRLPTEYINSIIKSKELLSFMQLEQEAVWDVIQLNVFHDMEIMFYNQAQSFIHHMINRIGTFAFWQILSQSGIYQNFSQKFSKITGLSLLQIEKEWIDYIKTGAKFGQVSHIPYVGMGTDHT